MAQSKSGPSEMMGVLEMREDQLYPSIMIMSVDKLSRWF